jgi:hypothetical protein
MMNFFRATNRLADLQADQLNDDEFSAGEREREGRHGCGHRSERHVKEDVETDKLIAEAV